MDTTLFSIPGDILKDIISQAKSTKSIRRTCKFFEQFCDKYLSKIRVEIGTETDAQFNSNISTANKFIDYLKSIVHKKPIELVINPDAQQKKEILSMILQVQVQVTKLKVFSQVEEIPPTVQKLSLECASKDALASIPTTLTSLSLGKTNIPKIEFPSSLQSLAIRRKSDILNSPFVLPPLTKLKVIDSYWRESSPTLPTTLKYLMLVMVSGLKDIQLHRLPLLETLELSDIPITDAVLRLPSKLSDLTLSSLHITPTFLSELPTLLQTLKIVNIKTKIDFSALTPKLPKTLRTLIIGRCVSHYADIVYPECLRTLQIMDMGSAWNFLKTLPPSVKQVIVERTDLTSERLLSLPPTVNKLFIYEKKKFIKEVQTRFLMARKTTQVISLLQ